MRVELSKIKVGKGLMRVMSWDKKDNESKG